MSTEDNKAVIRRILDGLGQKNMAIMDELCTPDFIYHDPANPQVRSREDFKQWFTGFLAAFPDLHISLESGATAWSHLCARASQLVLGIVFCFRCFKQSEQQ